MPRTKLPEILRAIAEIAARHGANRQRVPRRRRQHPPAPPVRRARRRRGGARARRQAGDPRACIELGGSVSGEHGIGVEKLALMPRSSRPTDLDAMRACAPCSIPRRAQPAQGAPRRSGAAWRLHAAQAGRVVSDAAPAAVRIHGRAAAAVHRPADRAELAGFLRATRGAVAPVGAARHPAVISAGAAGGGELPARSTCTGLDRIVDHAVDDLTITVEAGVTLARCRRGWPRTGSGSRSIRREPERATVGGLLATAAWGPLRPCKTPRRHLIGLARARRRQRAARRRARGQERRRLRPDETAHRRARHARRDRGGHVPRASEAGARGAAHGVRQQPRRADGPGRAPDPLTTSSRPSSWPWTAASRGTRRLAEPLHAARHRRGLPGLRGGRGLARAPSSMAGEARVKLEQRLVDAEARALRPRSCCRRWRAPRSCAPPRSPTQSVALLQPTLVLAASLTGTKARCSCLPLARAPRGLPPDVRGPTRISCRCAPRWAPHGRQLSWCENAPRP